MSTHQGAHGPHQAAYTTVVVENPEERPPSYTWLSCFVYWCCNPIVGGIAFVLSMASSSAADERRMDEARCYSKWAKWLSIIGIVLGVVTIIAVIVVFAAAKNHHQDVMDAGRKNYQDLMDEFDGRASNTERKYRPNW